MNEFSRLLGKLYEAEKKDFKNIDLSSYNLEVKNNLGETTLHYLVIEKKIELVKFLVTNGANINCRNDFQRTPLMEASIKGDFDVVKELIKLGADVNLSTDDEETAALFACELKHFDIAKLLVANGADPLAKTILGKTVENYLSKSNL